jgi:preprotein translocase subunit YajC
MYALSILAQESDGGGGSGITSLLVLLLIPFEMYFFLIRPQRKRMKEQATMQSSLGVGDEVITSSGVYGFITGEEDDLFWLEIDDDVQIRIAKAAIQGHVNAGADDTEATDATDDDGKTAAATIDDETDDA